MLYYVFPIALFLAFCLDKPVSLPNEQEWTGGSRDTTVCDTLFAPTDTVAPDTSGKRYTIQICSMSFPLSDSFFKGQYGVKVMQIDDLYRYVYSVYSSVAAARRDLPKVRKIYPDAFIREFDENKLGKAIDLNIEKLK